ncbi:MAG: DUF2804 family protein [Ruminococcus sp.]
MQKETESSCSVFHTNGNITGGWAKNPVFMFNSELYKYRQKIDHRQCFFAESKDCSIFISLEKCGFEFIAKIILRDKKIKGVAADCTVKKFILNKKEMPDLLDSKVLFQDKKTKIALTRKNDSRHIQCRFNNFAGFEDLSIKLTFSKKPGDSLNLSVPFEESAKNFYYKSFSPYILVNGTVEFGENKYEFSNDSGYCDCSSYVLPYRQIYRYLTANCNIDGNDFSLYLGSKLGDNLMGEENCYFSGGNIKKLSKIKFLGSDERIDRIWNFKAGIKAVDVTFKPEIYKNAPVFSKCDKTTVVYGRLYGEFNLIDNEPVILTDVPAQMFFTVI